MVEENIEEKIAYLKKKGHRIAKLYEFQDASFETYQREVWICDEMILGFQTKGIDNLSQEEKDDFAYYLIKKQTLIDFAKSQKPETLFSEMNRLTEKMREVEGIPEYNEMIQKAHMPAGDRKLPEDRKPTGDSAQIEDRKQTENNKKTDGMEMAELEGASLKDILSGLF